MTDAQIDDLWLQAFEQRGNDGMVRYRFAALVAAAERERLASEVHSCHANCDRPACVATKRAVAEEREACAKLCESINNGEPDWLVSVGEACAEAIRARGEHEPR